MKRFLLFLGILLVTLVIIGYNYVYQEHRDIGSETAVSEIAAVAIAKAFATDGAMASEKYLNNTLLIDGRITEVEKNALTIDEVVYVLFTSDLDSTTYQLNKKVNVKARCIGYDELLEVVKFDQGFLSK